MSDKYHTVICHSGGKFTKNGGGAMSYKGGRAYEIFVNKKTTFDEFRKETAVNWKYDPSSITIKYFLPNDNETLLTIGSDKNIQQMLGSYKYLNSIHVYVFTNEDNMTGDPSAKCGSSSRPLMVDELVALDDPDSVMAVDSKTVIDLTQESSQRKRANPSARYIFAVGQQFPSVYAFRDALRGYCEERGFVCTKTHNDKGLVTAKCKVDGCPWRIRASELSNTKQFVIRLLDDDHTCGCGGARTSVANQPRPSKKIAASITEDKVRDSPTIKPTKINAEMQLYSKTEVQGSFKDQSDHLRGLCKKVVETNPGSVAILTTKEDMGFHRLFIALHASITGFRNGCRPLLFLDTKSLNLTESADLLIATTLDGNDGIFPVAFAVVDTADTGNWKWFLEQMKIALTVSQPITFVSDRNMGLRKSISDVFGDSFYAYCLHYLTEDLKRDLSTHHNTETIGLILPYFFDAAYTPSLDAHIKCVKCIETISPKAYEMIMQSEPKYWANSLFQGARFNNLSCKISEPFYGYVAELPVVPMEEFVEIMIHKTNELLHKHLLDSGKWVTRITPAIRNTLSKETTKSRSVKVIRSYDCSFEVSDNTSIYVVNMERWSCTCRMWQVAGFPCQHAIAAIRCKGKNVYDYCSKYFTSKACQSLYLESVNTLGTTDVPTNADSSPLLQQSPVHHLPPCPPSTRRARSRRVLKWPVRCRRCHRAGHKELICQMVSPS